MSKLLNMNVIFNKQFIRFFGKHNKKYVYNDKEAQIYENIRYYPR